MSWHHAAASLTLMEYGTARWERQSRFREKGGPFKSEFCGLAWLCCPVILNLTQKQNFSNSLLRRRRRKPELLQVFSLESPLVVMATIYQRREISTRDTDGFWAKKGSVRTLQCNSRSHVTFILRLRIESHFGLDCKCAGLTIRPARQSWCLS